MEQMPLPFKEPIDDHTAVGIAEGFIECSSEEKMITAWQHLINTGLCWRLQGFFGRTASQLIEEGICTPAKGEG